MTKIGCMSSSNKLTAKRTISLVVMASATYDSTSQTGIPSIVCLMANLEVGTVWLWVLNDLSFDTTYIVMAV